MSVFSSAPSFVIVLHFRLERPTGDEDSGQSIWREIVSNIPCVDTNLPVFGWMETTSQGMLHLKKDNNSAKSRMQSLTNQWLQEPLQMLSMQLDCLIFWFVFVGVSKTRGGVEYTSSAQKLKHCQDEEITADVGETIMKGFGPCLGLYRLRKKIHKFAV